MPTPGFIADQERVEAKRAIDAARRANVAVYFVDARGLVASTPYAQAQQTGRGLDSRDVGAAQRRDHARRGRRGRGRREHRRLLGPQPERSRPRPAADRRRIARLLPARLPAGQERQGRRLPAARREGDAARRHGPGAPGILRRRSRSRLSGRDRATPPRFSDGVDAIDRAAERPTSSARSRCASPISRSARRAATRPWSCWSSRPTCAPSGSRPRAASCPTSWTCACSPPSWARTPPNATSARSRCRSPRGRASGRNPGIRCRRSST